ncbi:hypothetical protein ONZ45_g19015 [Pleurotus djamor]|nr:hypothetical protein ONZ45_g19015 [Pleurotus djamor]
MIFSLVAVLAFVSARAIGAATGTNVQSLRVGETVINFETAPVPASHISLYTNGVSPAKIPETSLTKRAATNCCQYGCTINCADGLSTSPDPPILDDCLVLRAALQQLAQSEVTGTYPCHYYGASDCPSFTIPPQYERAYWVGTCRLSYVNLNPIGGFNASFCHYLMAGTMLSVYNRCVGAVPGTTAGLCLQTLETNAYYALVLRHIDI